MVMKKGQAALDFLMTYGWAIALVVIVAAALFALGVFDVSNFVGTKAAGFSATGSTTGSVALSGFAVSGSNLGAGGPCGTKFPSLPGSIVSPAGRCSTPGVVIPPVVR